MSKSALPYTTAKALADDLVKQLAPFCERIEIAGSIRRQKEVIGDIELVAIPRTETMMGQLDLFGGQTSGMTVSRLDGALDQLVRQGAITNTVPFVLKKTAMPAWGEKYKKYWFYHDHEWVQVDLFIATPEQWGAILCIRTGPREFSQALVAYIRTETPYEQGEGYLKRKDTGAIVATPEEEDYFEAARVAYLVPRNRTVPALRQAVVVWMRQARVRQQVPRQNTTVNQQQAYTDDIDVRRRIRERLEAEAGIAS